MMNKKIEKVFVTSEWMATTNQQPVTRVKQPGIGKVKVKATKPGKGGRK